MITVDGRCFCDDCERRTKNVYRMVGRCGNCGQDSMLMLFRDGDKTHNLNCPVCGCWSTVIPLRLASEDEIPDAMQEARDGSE